MENIYINHITVGVCAILSLVIGAVWWSPIMFAKAWQREVGLSDEQLKEMNPAKTFGLSFVLAYLASYNLAFFLGDTAATWRWGIAAGLLAAVWAIAMYVIISLFEQRSLKLMLINSGYITVYFATIGFVLGIWR